MLPLSIPFLSSTAVPRSLRRMMALAGAMTNSY
jgi:hypothetical protein